MLTLDDTGVVVFLRSATMAAAAECAVRDAERRAKQYSPRKSALWAAWWLVKQEYERDVRELADRGGLLHFGCQAALDHVNAPRSAARDAVHV